MDLAEHLSEAAGYGDEAEVQRLLAAGARTNQADQFGRLPLHLAVCNGREGIVRLLVEADSATALARNRHGLIPLHSAASSGNVGVIKLLLAAAPAAATMLSTNSNWAPIHHAAYCGMATAVQLLVESALEVAFAPDASGRTPLHILLHNPCHRSAEQVVQLARCLVRAAPAVQPTLSALVQYSQRSATLFTDLVARLPFTQEQWQSIPAPCPDLARALPAVLERSAAEAGWLVGRLKEEQRARLQTALLCMQRVQHESNAALPAELSRRILALCLVDP